MPTPRARRGTPARNPDGFRIAALRPARGSPMSADTVPLMKKLTSRPSAHRHEPLVLASDRLAGRMNDRRREPIRVCPARRFPPSAASITRKTASEMVARLAFQKAVDVRAEKNCFSLRPITLAPAGNPSLGNDDRQHA